MPSLLTASALQRSGTLAQSDEPPQYQPPIASTKNFYGQDASMPYCQFEDQVSRERKRLSWRIHYTRCTREQLPLFEQTTRFQENAECIVRARWTEQGIWEDSWDPAEPEPADDEPPEQTRPRTWRSPCPWGPWPHERPAIPPRLPTPEPEPEPEPLRVINIFEPPTYISVSKKKPRVVPQSIIAQTRTARNPEASRPRPQFLYQVAREREWLELEITGNHRAVEDVDLDMLAYCAVKRIWKESFIWNDDWDDLPGDTWMHEREQSGRTMPSPSPDAPAPSYEHATRTGRRPAKRKLTSSLPVRRSARIAARRVRAATDEAEEGEEQRARKRLRRT